MFRGMRHPAYRIQRHSAHDGWSEVKPPARGRESKKDGNLLGVQPLGGSCFLAPSVLLRRWHSWWGAYFGPDQVRNGVLGPGRSAGTRLALWGRWKGTEAAVS